MTNERPGERPSDTSSTLSDEARARRDFLQKAGRFAAVTPPAIVLLLGTSVNSRAIAASNGVQPGHGYGRKIAELRPGHGYGDKNHEHTGPKGRP